MSDEYGLWIWDATSKLRFGVQGRYLRFHSRYSRAIIRSEYWSFTIPIPGATSNGSWVAYIRVAGDHSSFASWYAFSTDLLTVYVSSRYHGGGAMLIDVFVG